MTLADAVRLTFQQVRKYERGANRVSASPLVDLANAPNIGIPYFCEGMSASVGDQTPLMLWDKDALPDNDLEKDPMAKRETLEFVRANYHIPDAAIRKRPADLVKSAAKVVCG